MKPAALVVTALACLAASLPVRGAESSRFDWNSRVAFPTQPRGPRTHIDYPALGQVERLKPALDAVIAPDARLERLDDGSTWSEGPTWLPWERGVVFSDVPNNKVFLWTEKKGRQDYLDPSGYTGRILTFREPGANGLATDDQGRLHLCQHGNRQIVRLEKDGSFTPVVQFYGFRKLNSPNDLVFNRRGDLYFTDPPYGLEGLDKSPLKELSFNGVYLRRTSGEVVLLNTSMTYPNGIALSPDEKTLYVSQSDSKNPVIRAFPVAPDGTLGDSRIFYDAAPLAAEGRKGGPDGLKVDVTGHLFATGPGGVLVLSPEGELLGILNTGEATANCCWGDDGSTLYITASKYFGRIRTRTFGHGFRK